MLLPHTRSIPSPACGGGIGRGHQGRFAQFTPSPTLPRKRGRGQTESAAPSSAKGPAAIGQSLCRHWPKCRIGIDRTAHRFARGNLLRQRRAAALDCAFGRESTRPHQRTARIPEKATPAWTLPPRRLRAKSLRTRHPPRRRRLPPPMRRPMRLPPPMRPARIHPMRRARRMQPRRRGGGVRRRRYPGSVSSPPASGSCLPRSASPAFS
jgi:hypothetical protein